MPALPSKARPSPRSASVFVGREGELGLLSDLLERARVVSIVGPPGIGKTTLARALFESRPPAAFCDVTEAKSRDALLRAVADGLELSVRGQGDDAIVEIGLALADRGPLLVVIDNFEQLPREASIALESWVESAPELTLVVTTRRRLGLDAEHCFEIGPLPLDAGRKLFVERARRLRPTWSPSDEELSAIDAIVERLEGIPLSIELCAARARVLTPQQTLARLDDGQALLHRVDDDDAPPRAVDRHRSLVRTIAASWDLLDEDERRALARLSVFRGGFSLEAAADVLATEEPLDVLERLRDRSLLRAEAIESVVRFGFFESIRGFADAQLSGAAREDAELRHARHYARACAPRGDLLVDVSGGRYELPPERENLLVAFQRTRERDAEIAARVAYALLPFALVEQRLEPYEAILEEGARLAHRAGLRDVETDLWTELAGERGHRWRGDAKTASDRSLEALASDDDPRRRLRAMIARLVALRIVGAHEERERLEREVIAEADAFGDPDYRSRVHGQAGYGAVQRDDQATSEAYFRNAADLARQGRSRTGLGYGFLRLIHYCFIDEGLAREGLATAAELLDLVDDIRDPTLEAYAHQASSNVFLLTCDLDAADERNRVAMRIARRIGHGAQIALFCMQEAVIAQSRRAHDAAMRALGDFRAAATRASLEAWNDLYVDRTEALLRLDEGDAVGADRVLARALARGQAPLGRPTVAEVLLDRAVIDRLLHREDATASMERAAAAGERAGSVHRADAFAFLAATQAYDPNGDGPSAVRHAIERAEAALARVDASPVRARVRWLLEVASGRDPGALSFSDVSLEARRALRVAEALRAKRTPVPPRVAEPDVLHARRDGRLLSFRGMRIDLGRRAALRRIAEALVARRQRDGARALSLADVVAAGWPGERMHPDSAATRVYTAVRTLRAMGLRDVLLTRDDGYMLDPDVVLDVEA